MDLAVWILGQDGSVISADCSRGVEVLHNVVVGSGDDFARVCPDVDKNCVWLSHLISPLVNPLPRWFSYLDSISKSRLLTLRSLGTSAPIWPPTLVSGTASGSWR